MLVESVFNIPGIGRLNFDAINHGDFPIVQGTIVLAAFFIIIANIIVDIVYAYPRSAGALRVSATASVLLDVTDLNVEFPTEDGIVHAVDGISYSIAPGRTLGIVGESGSGKSVSSLTMLGLTRTQGARVSGAIMFEGRDLITLKDEELRRIRGNDIAMIFQDPLSALHPFYKVGKQLMEAVLIHRKVSKRGRPRPRRRPAGARRHPGSAPTRRAVPARVLRRYASAGDDRHGAGQRAQAADRRRADHRA